MPSPAAAQPGPRPDEPKRPPDPPLDWADRLVADVRAEKAARGVTYHHALKSPAARDALDNARLAVDEDPVRLQLESDDRKAGLALVKALRLAPTIDVAEALLRGERVPLSMLDQRWAKAYGLLR